MWQVEDVASVLCTCLFLIACYYTFIIARWYLDIYQVGVQLEKLPGSDRHWLFGHLKAFPGPTEAGLLWSVDQSKRHGSKVYKMWFGPFRPVAVLVHPETAKMLLKTTEPKAMKGKGAYSLVVPWLGEGLLLTHGEKWQRNRRLLTPAFHFDILKPYMLVYNECVDIMMDEWLKQLQVAPAASIEIFSSVSLCTLDIILRCAFSYSADVQRTGRVLWYIDWIYYKTAQGKEFAAKCAYVHSLAESIITRRKKALDEKTKTSPQKRLDFLDILLEARDEDGKGLSDEEIRHEVDTFLFAGHDTTASAISWCLYHLAKYPDIQARVRREVDELLDGRGSSEITWNDLPQLPYLTMCVKESLRRTPPVPVISRDVTTPVDVEGVTLVPGTIIDVHIYAIHHNSSVWGDDHMEYKPERFEAENMKNMDPYSFIPFSAGPRNCIGQSFALHEVKVVTARILHRFILNVDPMNEPEMAPLIVLRAKDGIKLLLTPRAT